MQRLHLGRSQVAVQLQRRFEDAHLVDDALFQLQHKLVVLRVVDDELGREKRRLFLKLNKIFFKIKQNLIEFKMTINVFLETFLQKKKF